MRGVHVTILAVGVFLLGGVASAQGIGAVAAQEKQKRRSGEATAGKVYTEDDLGPSLAPVSLPQQLPESADEEAPGEEAGEGEAATDTSPTDEERQAEAAWRQELEQAQQEAGVYRDVIQKMESELGNVYTGGLYTQGRASRDAFLEENRQKLAETEQRIADLQEEGRRKGYR